MDDLKRGMSSLQYLGNLPTGTITVDIKGDLQNSLSDNLIENRQDSWLLTSSEKWLSDNFMEFLFLSVFSLLVARLAKLAIYSILKHKLPIDVEKGVTKTD